MPIHIHTVYFLRSSEGRTELLKLIRTGKAGARVIGRARILVKLDGNISGIGVKGIQKKKY